MKEPRYANGNCDIFKILSSLKAANCFPISVPSIWLTAARTTKEMRNYSQEPTILVAYRSERLAELILMWRASFEAGVGIKDLHPLEAQRQYFLDEVLPKNEVRLAMLHAQLVGFVAASSESVAQLYVRVGFHRRGIGTLMLDWAKAQSDGSLWLYTFQRNLGACAFYERSGFTAAARGFEPMWQLDDVKYQWNGGA